MSTLLSHSTSSSPRLSFSSPTTPTYPYYSPCSNPTPRIPLSTSSPLHFLLPSTPPSLHRLHSFYSSCTDTPRSTSSTASPPSTNTTYPTQSDLNTSPPSILNSNSSHLPTLPASIPTPRIPLFSAHVPSRYCYILAPHLSCTIRLQSDVYTSPHTRFSPARSHLLLPTSPARSQLLLILLSCSSFSPECSTPNLMSSLPPHSTSPAESVLPLLPSLPAP